MQYQQRATPTRSRPQRRGFRELTPGTLTTAVTIGAVVLIVAITFFADWFQIPQLGVSAPGQFVSPNGDGNNDSFTVNYRLDDTYKVDVRVLSGQNVVRTIQTGQEQVGGDHFIAWDGRNDAGTVVPDGTYQIEVVASGTMRSTSQMVNVDVDTIPPVVQLANLDDQSRVNTPDLTIDGITEPGTVVWLTGNSQPLRVDNTGRFTYPTKLLDGENRFEIMAIDPAGNTTRLTRTISLVTEPPEITLVRPLDNEWTSEQMLTVEGRTLPGTTLMINQQRVSIGADGYFQHQVVLNQGDNTLRLVATDDLGNITTVERVVHLKTGTLPIQINIQDGVTVGEPEVQLIGRVEPGSNVFINGRAVPVNALGDFQTTQQLTLGNNAIEIEARDVVGNVSRMVRNVNYTIPANDGLARFGRNLEQLPILIVPSILVVAGILAFIYLRQNRVALSLSVDQPTFLPGLPGEEKTLSIMLDLSKTARVSLEVWDQQGYPRATILHNRRKMGRQHVFYWNGYDDRGRALPPGDYTIKAEAGAPPLQVTSAVQVRIDRQGGTQVQTPTHVRTGTIETRR